MIFTVGNSNDYQTTQMKIEEEIEREKNIISPITHNKALDLFLLLPFFAYFEFALVSVTFARQKNVQSVSLSIVFS